MERTAFFCVSGCFLFCFDSMYKLNKVQFFFAKTKYFSHKRQAFTRSQHCFLRSEENINFITLLRLTFSSDLRKQCCDLVKAYLPLKKFCSREKVQLCSTYTFFLVFYWCLITKSKFTLDE